MSKQNEQKKQIKRRKECSFPPKRVRACGLGSRVCKKGKQGEKKGERVA
jgi:hypothetical protein